MQCWHTRPPRSSSNGNVHFCNPSFSIVAHLQTVGRQQFVASTMWSTSALPANYGTQEKTSSHNCVNAEAQCTTPFHGW